MISFLIFDDEREWCESLRRILHRNRYFEDSEIHIAVTKDEADYILKNNQIDVVLLDLLMPEINGEDVLLELKNLYPYLTVIIVSGINDIKTVVRCMKNGASDYIIKSMSMEEIIAVLLRVEKIVELNNENKRLKDNFTKDMYDDAFDSFITNSNDIKQLFKYAKAIAQGSQSILITGESGVGKGILAKIIHEISRPSKPFVSLNVAGLDNQMFDDTLFGHTKGAFTGAEKNRNGLIAAADDGTVFLDEIGELDMQSQVKLLYLTQDKEFRKLGQDNTSKTNARFIFATNQDLQSLQNQGLFRKDLFYRLSTHRIHIPPLRERPEDITVLSKYFLQEAAKDLGKQIYNFDTNVIFMLNSLSLPGNARQLRAVIYDAVARCNNRDYLILDDFKNIIDEVKYKQDNSIILPENKLQSIDEVVDEYILKVLRLCNNNQTKAAPILGISQSALSRRIKQIKL